MPCRRPLRRPFTGVRVWRRPFKTCVGQAVRHRRFGYVHDEGSLLARITWRTRWKSLVQSIVASVCSCARPLPRFVRHGFTLCESVFCEIPGWYRDSDLERVLRINGSKPSSHQEISYLLSRMSSSAWFSSPKTSRATKTSAVTFTLRSLVRTLRRRLDFPFSRAAPRASKILVCPQSAR